MAASVAWTVGDVKITKLVEVESIGSTAFILPQATADAVMALPWMIPHYATSDGRLKMTIHSLIVETPTRTIIVDTGLGNDKTGRGIASWNHLKTPYLAQMAAAGYPRDSIDTVVCTHLHVDHVGWNTSLVEGIWVPTFPQARYVFVRDEYAFWRDHSDTPQRRQVFVDSVQPVVDAGLVDLVASDARIADEITLIPTPGHSPAHVALHIRSNGDEALLAGDAAHHPIQMAHPEWSSEPDSDRAQSAQTRRELFARFAGTGTMLIGGHYDAGHLVRDGDAFRLIPV